MEEVLRLRRPTEIDHGAPRKTARATRQDGRRSPGALPFDPGPNLMRYKPVARSADQAATLPGADGIHVWGYANSLQENDAVSNKQDGLDVSGGTNNALANKLKSKQQ